MTEVADSPIRVVVVDDHAVVRRGLVDLINDEAGLTVCGACATPDQAMDLIRAERPHVAIIDLSLGVHSGLDLIVAARSAHPALRVLVLSALDEQLFAERAFRAGAHGYVMKDEGAEILLAALRRVASGRRYASEALSERALAGFGRSDDQADRPAIDRLTDRERHVLRLVGQGVETRDIAEQLSLSVKTVESHYANIKEKLGLRTGRELVRFAVGWAVGLTAGARPSDRP